MNKERSVGFIFPTQGFDETLALPDILLKLRLAITDLYRQGYRTFVTGLEQGADILAADEVCALKRREGFEGITLRVRAASPEQSRGYDPAFRTIYTDIIEHSDHVAFALGGEGDRRQRDAGIIDICSAILCGGNGGGAGPSLSHAAARGLKLYDLSGFLLSSSIPFSNFAE